MNRHRVVALQLAALAPQDSRWLFGRLPAPHRARIERELPAARRLQQADPAHCAQWLRQLTGADPSRSAEVSADCVETLEYASVESVRSVLQGLPHRLLAEVVWFRNWRWKPALMERLSETERQRIVEGPARGRALAPAVLKALLELVAERVRAQAAGRPFDSWVQDA